jgi:GMP synthase-like glutamine amidotransferase
MNVQMVMVIDNAIHDKEHMQFTTMLYSRLKSTGILFAIATNWDRFKEMVRVVLPTRIVLTGSALRFHRKVADPVILFNQRVIRFAIENKIRLVGICFGAQILAHACGGKIEACASGFQVGERRLSHSGDRVQVAFHDRIVYTRKMQRFTKALDWMALKDRLPQTIAAFQVRGLPIYGYLFHPEVHEESFGRYLIDG